jgi:uncharacterized protein YkwD
MARVRPIGIAWLLATLVAVAMAFSGSRPAGAREPAHASSGYTGALARLHNAERARHGLRRLHVSAALRRAARRHARDMVRRHYFGHVSRGGRDVVDRVAGTNYGRGAGFAVQENLYWWSVRRSPAAVLNAWMGSAAHRANVLGPRWRQVGFAAVMHSPFGGGVTVVAVYGTPARR